jgi:hypothetical protein
MVVERVDGTDLKFKNPGRLLLVVIGFLFWAIGFIDLLGHTSAEPDVFGLYSLPFFVMLLVYGSTIAVWFALFFNSNLLSRVFDGVRYIQRRTWLSVPIFVGFGSALWVIFEWDRWSRLPGLQVAAFGLLLWAAFILLFTDWNATRHGQLWRKIIAYPLIALILVEAIIQLLAWFSLLPGVYKIGGDFVPYERIYNNVEGSRNDFANRYGWTFPNFELDESKKRILIVGGSFVQALQVLPEQQVGVLLSELINQGAAEDDLQAEVISIGLPGFGLSPFLFDEVIRPPNILDYDELIVFFHLGDDFQSPVESLNAIEYEIGDSGVVEVNPDDARLRHDLTHYYLRGVLSFQPVESIRSNYLTPQLISSLLGNQDKPAPANFSQSENREIGLSRSVGKVTSNYGITETGHAGIKSTSIEIIPGGNNFIFDQSKSEEASNALIIAGNMLETAQEIALANDINIRLVTIPVFPESFFNTYQSTDWQPQVSELELFFPEDALIEIADELQIQILPMGKQMIADRLTVEQIKSMYYSNGHGHFTPQGHEYFASSIFNCLFSDAETQLCLK